MDEQKTKRGRWGLWFGFLACAILPFLGTACGAILGLDDPMDRDGGMALDAPGEAAACMLTQKECSGFCVAKNDPKVGCGGDCTACQSPQNAKVSCVLGNGVYACGLSDGDCHAGFGNCDQNAANGCETQLTTRAACGDCANNCTNLGLQYCSPSASGTFSCTNTCMQPNIVCGGECVDPTSDPKHCGSMCEDCTTANGTGTCVGGVCQLACDTAFCRSGNTCVASNDQACFSQGCAACANGQVCDNTGGTGCVATTCVEDLQHCGATCAFCSGHCANHVCVCTAPQDDQHCGIDCNVDCTLMGAHCQNGTCMISPTTDAGGGSDSGLGCVQPYDHSPQCGVCGVSCTGGNLCCTIPAIPTAPPRRFSFPGLLSGGGVGPDPYACMSPEAGTLCKP